ncbi:MAG: hypothetical protein IJY23_01140 [Clostridia bacterium]|nr:hypothetical protein [Clostridia bacterium]
MTWTFDHEPIFSELVISSGKLHENMRKAYARAKERFSSVDPDDYIIITVEGYRCVAYVTNHFTPIEIAKEVFPFDRECVYPMQAVKAEPRFWTYAECMRDE